MSIYSNSQLSIEASKPQDVETEGENIPQDIVEDARVIAERFFQKELPSVKIETRDWVIKYILPAMVDAEKEIATISESEVALFLKSVSERTDFMIDELGKISFSRGHELDRYTYPTVQEFKPITSWLTLLKEKHKLYKRQDRFATRLQEAFQPFFHELVKTIRERALASRRLQYEQILSNPQDEEFGFKKVVTEAHIDALKNNPKQTLLELRDLLNLGRNPKIDRVPSMEEQEAFRFLLTIADLMKS